MSYFNIISIDPGNNLGVSIYSIDNEFNIIDIKTFYYCLDNYVNNSSNVGRMLDKLQVLSNIMNDLVNTYKPLAVIEESAFMNMRFPKAVMQLSQYIATIELAIMSYDSSIKIFRYPPKYIKKYIGATGNADKDDMLSIVKTISDITNHINTDLITEHEIDSLAIGYIAYQEIKDFPYLLWYI